LEIARAEFPGILSRMTPHKYPYIILFCLLLLFAASCKYLNRNLGAEEPVLARVYDDYLYASDVKNLVPAGTSPNDSLILVKNYVENWVRNRLVLNKANDNLTKDQKDFAKQLEDYRNSLVVYTYESQLIKQSLDTLVKDDEIEAYYDANKSNFLLKDHIVKVAYVKLYADSARAIKTARKFLEPDSLVDYDRFEKFCLNRSTAYLVSINSWHNFRDLLQTVPIDSYNEEDFIQNRKLIEVNAYPFVYILRFYQFTLKDALSPLSFERNNIKSIIINMRKVELVSKMQDELYKNALKNKDFEVF
jgi:hypothetical protein